MPRLPVSMEARSLSRSPNRLPVTITSNWRGLRTSCMAQLSAYMWLSATSGNSRAPRAVTVWRQSRPDSITLAFSTLHIRFWRLRASSNATRATRSISLRGVDLGVDAALLAVRQGFDAAWLAEIDAAGALAHDHDVEPAHHVGLEGRGVDQRVQHDGRAQVGEQAEFAAQGEDGEFGPVVEAEMVPLRAADGAEQHGVRLLGAGDGLLADGAALGVDRGTADQSLAEFEAGLTVRGPSSRSPGEPGSSLRGRCRRRGGGGGFLLAGISGLLVEVGARGAPHPGPRPFRTGEGEETSGGDGRGARLAALAS